MKQLSGAIDPRLSVVAKRANVRPSHVHHTFAAIKELGDAFEPESFAAFCQLEARHIVAIVDALTALNLMPVRRVSRSKRGAAPKTRLSDDWVMPADWVAEGRVRRCWTMDVCETEAKKFVSSARAHGRAYANWRAAWHNWIDGSYREDGTASATPENEWTPERMAAYLANQR